LVEGHVAVHPGRDVGGQGLLKCALVRSLRMLGLEGLNFFAAFERKNPNVVTGIGVGRVEPKLVKLVG